MSTEPTTLVLVPEIDETLKVAVIAPASQLTLREVFTPHFVEFKALAEEAKSVAINAPVAAKRMRLKLRAVRCAAEASRKQAGEDAKNYKLAVDSLYKVLETNLTPVEDRMRDIEETEIKAEMARKEATRIARVAELTPFASPDFYDLGNMPEIQYRQLVNGAKAAKEAADALVAKAEADRIAAAKLAEEQRIAKEAADKAERDRLAAENARLAEEAKKAKAAKEAADRENARKLKEAADKAVAEQAKRDAQAAKEKADRDAADKAKEDARLAAEKVAADQRAKEQAVKDAEAAKAKAASDLVAKQEREKREAAERQIAYLAAQTAKADAEKADAAKRAAAAPDKVKLAVLAAAIRALPIPTLSSEAGIALQAKITSQLGKAAIWVESEAGKL